ncbi:MAG: hypothetical protein ACWA5A_03125 [Marinibacterium sp.]
MIRATFSDFRRMTSNLARLWSAILVLAATPAYAQDNEVGTVPTASYSFLPEEGADRQLIDLGILAKELNAIGFSVDDLFSLEVESLENLEPLRSDPFVQGLDGEITQHLGEGIRLGGASAGAAMVILGVTAIAAEKCEMLNTEPDDDFVLYKDPILGRSSMRAVQFSIDDATMQGLGRGQFDIYTTKFALCRNTRNNDIVGIPINVRWVFNVNGDSLTMKKGNLTGPKDKPYKQNFHAEGMGIQLVLMQIDGRALPPNSPVYAIVEDACIDIWLPEIVDDFDISFPVSIPDAGVFCAGGYCKDRPPGLDATH